MTITKNNTYTNTTDKYLTYTFTGKTKAGKNYTQADKYYQFTEAPKDANNTWLKPKNTWKAESFVQNYFTKNN